jgi:hypothetical protein
MNAQATVLTTHTAADEAEKDDIQGEAERFSERWQNVATALQEKQAELTAAQDKGPSKSFLQSLSVLLAWLRESELALQDGSPFSEHKIKV